MTTQPQQDTDWTATDLALSNGPQLFANAGISRLRAAVEQQFASRELGARAVQVLGADAERALPAAGSEGIQAFAALSPTRSLPTLLAQCANALRPGGRLVLDLRSPAHWQAAFGSELGQWPDTARDDPATAFCAPSDLLALAAAQDLALVSLQPYAGLWDNALLYRRLPHRFKWLRLLSWLESDEALFDLALLLEQQVVAALSPTVSGRYLVTLEKGADPAGSVNWLARLASREAVLESPTLDGLAALLPLGPAQFAAQTAPLAVSLRTRHVVYLLQRALAEYRPGFASEAYLDEATRAQLQRWHTARDIDTRNMAILRQWAGDVLVRGDVNLAAGLDYQLATSLLRDYFKTHSGVSA